MGWVLLWTIMAVVVAIVASSKGRSAGGWFVYGFLVWPVALVHALVMPRDSAAETRRAAAAGRRACPHCAEMILPAAKVCPHCQRDLAEGWSRPPLAAARPIKLPCPACGDTVPTTARVCPSCYHILLR